MRCLGCATRVTVESTVFLGREQQAGVYGRPSRVRVGSFVAVSRFGLASYFQELHVRGSFALWALYFKFYKSCCRGVSAVVHRSRPLSGWKY